MVFLNSYWVWCGVGRAWRFPGVPEKVHVQDVAELRSGGPAVGPVWQGRSARPAQGLGRRRGRQSLRGVFEFHHSWRGQAARQHYCGLVGLRDQTTDNHHRRLAALKERIQEDTIATKASKHSESHMAAQM